MANATEGYKDHRPGSNKGVVHKMFDDKGAEAAIKKAEALGLQQGTARTWISVWKGGKAKKAKKADGAAKKKVVKKAAKAPAKRTAKKAAAPAQATA